MRRGRFTINVLIVCMQTGHSGGFTIRRGIWQENIINRDFELSTRSRHRYSPSFPSLKKQTNKKKTLKSAKNIIKHRTTGVSKSQD